MQDESDNEEEEWTNEVIDLEDDGSDIETAEYETELKPGKTEEEEKQQRISKQEQREILLKRRRNKPNEPLVIQLKAIWEQLRVKNLKKKERFLLMDELMTMVSGRCLDIIFKHDASRIIQCCLKYGSDDQRNAIAEELKTSKNYRQDVISSFYGNVKRLIRHKEASVVIEECYSQYATGLQKTHLMEEFYGPEFSIFKSTSSKTLSEILEEHPTKAISILAHLKQSLFSLLEKGGVSIGSHSIIHRAVLDYFKQLFLEDKKHIIDIANKGVKSDKDFNESDETKPEELFNFSQVAELIEQLTDHLVHILHTREGSQVTQMCITYASPKARKVIVKSFKGFVKKISIEQYGFTTLLSLFECVDDTVLIGKSIIAELISDAPLDEAASGEKFGILQLSRDHHASRVLLYLLAGRNRKFIPSFVINELESLDQIRLLKSKKELLIKRREVLKVLLQPLLEGLNAGLAEVCRCKVGNYVLSETLKLVLIAKNDGDLEISLPKFEAIVTLILEKLVQFADKSVSDSQVGELVAKAASTTSATAPILTKKRPFNAVMNLRDESITSKQLESGIDVSEHVLLNRYSTFVFADLIRLNKEKPSNSTKVIPDDEKRTVFSLPLAKTLLPKFHEWVRIFVDNPSNTSGCAFVFTCLWETENTQIRGLFKEALKNGRKEIEISKKKLAIWQKARKTGESKDETGSGKQKTKKAKVEKSTAGKITKKVGVEILLDAVFAT